MIRRLALCLALIVPLASHAQQVYPTVGLATTLTTGGTAQIIVSAHVNGCYVTNPLSAADQGLGSAEAVTVNPVTTATANGYGSNSTLQPGQSWSCPQFMATDLSAIAATSGHRLSVVRW